MAAAEVAKKFSNSAPSILCGNFPWSLGDFLSCMFLRLAHVIAHRCEPSEVPDCSCNEPETQWHIMGMGSCNSYPIIRRRFSQMREDMMEKVGIPNSIQKAIMANHEPNEEGALAT